MTKDDIQVHHHGDDIDIHVGKYQVVIGEGALSTGIDLLMDMICLNEIGLTKHDVVMAVADACIT